MFVKHQSLSEEFPKNPTFPIEVPTLITWNSDKNKSDSDKNFTKPVAGICQKETMHSLNY